jgi:hypothetical protein
MSPLTVDCWYAPPTFERSWLSISCAMSWPTGSNSLATGPRWPALSFTGRRSSISRITRPS